jgi:hypothetical protein
MPAQVNTIPDRVRTLRRNALVLYRSWWTTHYLIGTLGVLAGALAAGGAGATASMQPLKPWAWLFGAVAALCTSLVTFLGPITRAERYWKTFHFIDQACLEYESSLIDLKTLALRARDAGSLLVGITPTREAEDKAVQTV